MLLTIRGLRRTKNTGFVFLFIISAAVMINGIGRLDESGGQIVTNVAQGTNSWRAIEPPVMLLLLGGAMLAFQSNEKKS